MKTKLPLLIAVLLSYAGFIDAQTWPDYWKVGSVIQNNNVNYVVTEAVLDSTDNVTTDLSSVTAGEYTGEFYLTLSYETRRDVTNVVKGTVSSFGQTTAPEIAYFSKNYTNTTRSKADGDVYLEWDTFSPESELYDQDLVNEYVRLCGQLVEYAPGSTAKYRYSFLTLREFYEEFDGETVLDEDDEEWDVGDFVSETGYDPDVVYVYVVERKKSKVWTLETAQIVTYIEWASTNELNYAFDRICSSIAIPNNVSWGNVVSVKLGDAVNDVADGAFANSDISKFEVSGSKFSTNTDGTFLYSYHKSGYQYSDTLFAIGSGVVSGTYEIPTSVDYIVDLAMDNVSDVTLMSYNPNLTYNNLGGSGNSVIMPSELATSSVTALGLPEYLTLATNGNAAYGVKVSAGNLIADNVASLIQELADGAYGAGICYIDFTDCSSNGELGTVYAPSNLNPNCLFYFPSGTAVSGDNVVVGSTCENLNLVRVNKSPFYNNQKFTATTATLSGLPLSAKFTFVSFPFVLNGTDPITINGSDDVDLYSTLRVSKLTEWDETENKMSYEIITSGSLSSNVGYLVNTRDASSISSVTAEDVTVARTSGNMTYGTSNGCVCGATFQYVVGDYDNYNYYGMSNNKFVYVHGTAAYKPFSAYIRTPKSTSSAPMRYVVIDPESEEDLIEITDATSVDELTSVSDVNVAVNGDVITITTESAKAVSVVSVSGVSVFNGIVDGTKDINVSKGIYIVNGNKYIVK